MREVAIVAVPDIHIQPLEIPAKSQPRRCRASPIRVCRLGLRRRPSRARRRWVICRRCFRKAQIYQVQSALIQQCEKLRDRIALLDPPFARPATTSWASGRCAPGAAGSIRSTPPFTIRGCAWSIRCARPPRYDARYPAERPCSRAVCANRFPGRRTQGAGQRAAALGQDVTVVRSTMPCTAFSTPCGINAIRPLPGRGIRIFGARTVSSDPDWRFVNVRRLLMMIEKAIDGGDSVGGVRTERSIHAQPSCSLSLTSFLLSLWQRGALMGASAE